MFLFHKTNCFEVSTYCCFYTTYLPKYGRLSSPDSSPPPVFQQQAIFTRTYKLGHEMFHTFIVS